MKILSDAILLARGNLERAIDVNDGTQRLHEANYASDLELTGSKLDVDRFTIQMATAEENLRLYRRYDFAKETKQFLNDCFEARRELDRTLARTRSKLAQAQAKRVFARW